MAIFLKSRKSVNFHSAGSFQCCTQIEFEGQCHTHMIQQQLAAEQNIILMGFPSISATRFSSTSCQFLRLEAPRARATDPGRPQHVRRGVHSDRSRVPRPSAREKTYGLQRNRDRCRKKVNVHLQSRFFCLQTGVSRLFPMWTIFRASDFDPNAFSVELGVSKKSS